MEAKIVRELRAMSTTSGRFGAEDLSRLLRDAADIIAKLNTTNEHAAECERRVAELEAERAQMRLKLDYALDNPGWNESQCEEAADAALKRLGGG